ncbi:uncharacterized protein LOC100902881 [Galendromus occidentalis]|uniref:Uncharacterized protein LOC100902881 n=1 Tax=Galendromus occidentalis TaxID=34638 RepID=A0AAJ6QR27_9ACAR|nr:uncharacterized protein LOC100902881 [Galendromus occidentalis]
MDGPSDIMRPGGPPSSDSASISSFSQIEGFVKPDRILEYTRFGPWKNYSRITTLEKAFLGAWYIALLLSLGLTFYKLATSTSGNPDTTTYGAILIIAALFSFFYVTTGVHQEQPHEMIALCITNGIVLGYVVINFVNSRARHGGKIDEMKLARLVFTSVFSALFLPLSLYLARRYWTHKTLITFAVGSINPETQAMAQVLFMFLSALTFDLQLQLNFLILVMRQGFESANLTQALILISGILILIMWTMVGRFAARRECKNMLLGFVILSFPNLIYAVFAYVTLAKTKTNPEMFSFTLLCGGSAVLMRMLIFVLTYLLYRNFGKGLKDSIFQWHLPAEEIARRRRSTFAQVSTVNTAVDDN